MRASDPIFEIGQTTGGHKQEDRFWDHTLASVANHFGKPAAKVDSEERRETPAVEVVRRPLSLLAGRSEARAAGEPRCACR